MKIITLILVQCCLASSLYAQQFIPLWPDKKMPNSKGMQLDHIEERERISQVSEPGMYAFFTSKEENSGSAVLICPPGGYAKLTYNIAGFQFAKWLNTLGINAFVLIHRLPTSPDLIERDKGPVQDAQRAMKLIRMHAESWKTDSSKIGMMGASAGGHLASTLGTHSEDYSEIGDAADRFAFRPDFMILISPVISMGKYAHRGSMKNLLGHAPTQAAIDYYSNEHHLSNDAPPAFVVVAQNDPVVHPMNSLSFYQQMIDKGVSGSLHVFPRGAHSISLYNSPRSVDRWKDLCEDWLIENKIISTAMDGK